MPPMLEAIDGPIRMMIFGEVLLILVILWRSDLERRKLLSLSGLTLTVTAYLVISGPWPAVSPWIEAVLIGLATLIPFALWNLAWHLFDDDFSGRPWHIAIAVSVFSSGAAITLWPDQKMIELAVRNALRLAGIVVLLHAVWGIYRGFSGDLIERRRLARAFAIGLAIILVVSSLATEIALSSPDDRACLEPISALLILLTTTLFASVMLRSADLSFDAASPTIASDMAVPQKPTAPAIQTFVDAGGLFQSGLTVAGMAEQVHMPEYQLRRVINGQMGFRNFNAFLNSHRIAEAKKRLRDPALARQPILTIAMDLGYGSLGPFNRAFRDTTGMTPSAWRQSDTETRTDS